jgi:hypothetical protein
MKIIWSNDEIEYLKNNYGKVSTTSLAKDMNRSYKSILYMVSRLKRYSTTLSY